MMYLTAATAGARCVEPAKNMTVEEAVQTLRRSADFLGVVEIVQPEATASNSGAVVRAVKPIKGPVHMNLEMRPPAIKPDGSIIYVSTESNRITGPVGSRQVVALQKGEDGWYRHLCVEQYLNLPGVREEIERRLATTIPRHRRARP
jgi:hypothetical protein